MTIVAAAMLAAPNASALIYSGSLSSGAGLTGFEDWSEGSTLSWTVSNEEENCDGWMYSYSLTVLGKDISHAIVEVSDIFEDSNILDASGGAFSLDDYSADTQGASNPGMLGSMRGIKVDVQGDTKSFQWSFCSNITPVWGDFYAKSGKTGGNEVYLYNTGFAALDPQVPVANGSVNNHIIVPDSLPTGNEGPGGIPEPSTSMLGALGLLMILRKRIR